MEYLSVTKYAKLKKVHRNAIYLAGSEGRIDIDKSSGVALIFMTDKNKDWKPSKIYQKNGRKEKKCKNVK